MSLTHQALHQLDSPTHRRDLLEHAVLLTCALFQVVLDAELVLEAREEGVQILCRSTLH